MTPHDLAGLPINRGDIVAVAVKGIGNKLCFGVVSEVNYDTGAIEVRTVMLCRVPTIKKYKLLFPATQTLLVTKDRFEKNTEEHKIIRQLIREHNS